MENNKVAKLIEPFDLDLNRSNMLIEKFGNIFELAEQWGNRIAEISVSNITDEEKSSRGKEALKIISKKISEIESTRKIIKEPALREGQAIDKVSNVIKDALNPLKLLAEDLSKIIEIKEAKRLIEISEKRMQLIAPYSNFIALNIDFGRMTEQDFQLTFDTAKLAKETKEKTELENKQKAEQEKAENERLKAENERLKKDADIKAKALEIERKRADEKLQKEKEKIDNEAKEAARIESENQAKIQAQLKETARIESEKAAKLEAEIKTKLEAEKKAATDKLIAEKKAAAAPDKQKLITLSERFKSVNLPELKTDNAKSILQQIEILQNKLVNFIIEKSNTL